MGWEYMQESEQRRSHPGSMSVPSAVRCRQKALRTGSLCLWTFLIRWDLTPVLVNKQMKLVQQTHLLIYLFKDVYFTVMPWREHHNRVI